MANGRLTLWGASQMIQSFISQEVEPPASFFLALIRETPPTLYVSGSELDEPVAPSYTRVEIPNDVGYWETDVQPQVILTAQDIVWNPATEDWGLIRHWAVTDAPADGNCYFIGSMDNTLAVSSGDTAMVGAGDLAVSLGPFFEES